MLRFRLGIPRIADPFEPGNCYASLDNAKTTLFWEIR